MAGYEILVNRIEAEGVEAPIVATPRARRGSRGRRLATFNSATAAVSHGARPSQLFTVDWPKYDNTQQMSRVCVLC